MTHVYRKPFPWPDTDIETLIAMNEACRTYEEMCIVLPDRTYTAIANKLAVLGFTYNGEKAYKVAPADGMPRVASAVMPTHRSGRRVCYA